MILSKLPFSKLIETMYANGKNIPLLEHHFQRLNSSFRLLKISTEYLPEKKIQFILKKICKKNGSSEPSKIRLTIDMVNTLKSNYQFDITTENIAPLPSTLSVCISEKHLKYTDQFSSLKSNDRALYNQIISENQSSDCNEIIILNSNGNISEGTISNVFILQAGKWFTPPLNDGCVEGVLRNMLLNNASFPDWSFQEKSFTRSELLNAEEVCLTNAVRGIMPVSRLQSKELTTTKGMKLAEHFKEVFFRSI